MHGTWQTTRSAGPPRPARITTPPGSTGCCGSCSGQRRATAPGEDHNLPRWGRARRQPRQRRATAPGEDHNRHQVQHRPGGVRMQRRATAPGEDHNAHLIDRAYAPFAGSAGPPRPARITTSSPGARRRLRTRAAPGHRARRGSQPPARPRSCAPAGGAAPGHRARRGSQQHAGRHHGRHPHGAAPGHRARRGSQLPRGARSADGCRRSAGPPRPARITTTGWTAAGRWAAEQRRATAPGEDHNC